MRFFNHVGFLLIGLTLIASQSRAELTARDIRDRLSIRGDSYVLDESGRRVLADAGRTEWNADRETGVIKGDMSSRTSQYSVALRYRFEVTDSGQIKVLLEEYGTITGESTNPQFKNLLDRQEFVLENFAPIVWKPKNTKPHNVVYRFTPVLSDYSEPLNVNSLPISGKDVLITDTQGYLWADGVGFTAKYVGVTSHRGTVVFSYLPFKDAREMGSASGNLITLKVDKGLRIKLRSSTAFLPAGMSAKIYAIYLPKRKTTGLYSVNSFSSDAEEQIQKALRR